MRITRLIRIVYIFWRYGLYELAAPVFGTRSRSAHWFRFFVRGDPASLGRRLREALQELGPIFVKFGQVLSTRRDLLWPSMADELSFLQDQVQPFPADLAKIEIERGLGRKISEAFATFESEPTASASIAQIHFATLPNGKEVAVKVLRPGMAKVIDRDLQWLRFAAAFLQRFSVDARRLRLGEVIDEFDRYLHDELDLIREAANASQLQRNFSDSYILRIPTIYWEWCATNVLTMERMHGVPVSQIDRMRAAGIDFKKLSRDGVQIFFTQVFEHGFFHADMHPGNILVGISGGDFNRYIALDFGIVGTLSDSDKSYLAQNFLAFFRRDYRWAARLHLESGWAPPTTRVDELESAIRTCCEPFFDRPLKSISLGLVLLRLFQTSRRFNIEVQPQLVLLQKTLLNIEGLGRQLDPELDLWVTAQPILERWMKKQIGLSGWIDRLKMEAPKWAVTVPEIPRLLHQFLSQKSKSEAQVRHLTEALSRAQRKIRIGWFLLFLFLFVHLFLAEGEMFSKIIGTILTFL